MAGIALQWDVGSPTGWPGETDRERRVRAMNVLFVCSNDTHVKTFEPVARVLSGTGATVTLLSLDPLYRQAATPAALSAGLRSYEPTVASARSPHQRFYGRPVPAVWRDVLRARHPIRELLAELSPNVVVVGNDFGLVEKLVMHTSRSEGVRKLVLIQDGRLTPQRAPRPGLKGSVRSLARTVGSALLRLSPWGYLAASEYGQGGADVICAVGRASAELLRNRSQGRSRVLITGQPRYDRLAALMRFSVSGELRKVAVFTSPFEVAGLGTVLQRRQDEMIRSLRTGLEVEGISLLIKPHPREDADIYIRQFGRRSVTTKDPAGVLSDADLAIIGMSTLVEEAAIIGCPVVVPGMFLYGPSAAHLLPDRTVFERVDNESSLLGRVLYYRDPLRRQEALERQRLGIRDVVSFDPRETAATKVAAAILE